MNHIIIDLEMNTTSKESGMKNEIIEIGAVKLGDDFSEIARFHSYVKPENGEIVSIITELTGITEEDVKDAPVFYQVMEEFFVWAGKEVTFYSWSNCDKKQFEYESEFKEYKNDEMKKMLASWVDLQAEYDRVVGTSQTVALDNALKSAGIKLIGTPHTALGDAINTAELFKVMRDKKKLNEKLGTLIEMFKHKELTTTFLDMFPEMASYLKYEEEKELTDD